MFQSRTTCARELMGGYTYTVNLSSHFLPFIFVKISQQAALNSNIVSKFCLFEELRIPALFREVAYFPRS